jgi:hypothetical protein
VVRLEACCMQGLGCSCRSRGRRRPSLQRSAMTTARARSGQNERVCEIEGSKGVRDAEKKAGEGLLVMATSPFSSDSGDGVLPLQRERERAGASKASSGRWGEVDGGEWHRTSGSDARARLKKGRGRRGVWWFSSDAIGWGGDAPWTVSWTDSIYANVEFERVLHQPGLGRFQCGCKRSGVWRGWLGRLQCNAGVAC